ncbi:MAG: hypothetical protein ONB46_07970 [candidate division KSB1 bacterium]|nr:hypothetical protein [candidate division KSB1 bacterium]MDZ7365794.1 hypothetical protein [candidate division KSB1 bacterium]MDZ7403727.1 hypothetical protein [candidate division KSB1 bacterium]
MIATVEGVYKKGKVELFEIPIGLDESPVLVTFLPKSASKPPQRRLVYGQFVGKNMSTLLPKPAGLWSMANPIFQPYKICLRQ